MDLASFRKDIGLTQAQTAAQLGLRSKGHICNIEAGRERVSPKLAKRIERWSGGKVPASALRPDVFGEAAA